MRYKISGNELRTENAAKPHTQQSKLVASYLNSIEVVDSLLDFGCGKLRYSDILTSISKRTTFVDSEIQLFRTQVVRGIKTTVDNYVTSNYENSIAISFESIKKHKEKYDLITCTNVLSAIPCDKTLKSALGEMRRLLKEKGTIIFINQHKSSYFKKYETGQRHMHGYLYNGRKGTSYYGILCKIKTTALLEENGFKVKKSWCKGESNYIEASTICS